MAFRFDYLRYQCIDKPDVLLYSRAIEPFLSPKRGSICLVRGGAMKRVRSGLFGGVLLVLLTATVGWAQAGATAQISGTVKDSSGGVLPGADVTATQTETGFKRSVVTDSDGAFAFPSIPTGPYRLEVMLQGFRSYLQTGIVLQVNDSPVVPITLPLGAVA